jgi:hypothetical protein
MSAKNLAVIRGSEQQIRLIVDGKTQDSGSWMKVVKWHHTPLVTETQTGYCGDEFETNDQMLHGHHCTFTFNQTDDTMLEFLLDLQARAEDHLPPADVQLIVRESYRDGSSTSDILFSRNGVLSPTSRGAGGQKDYVAGEWSFHCQRMSRTGS